MKGTRAVNEDFVSASARHALDAEHLLGVNRPDNAGYLAGYAVECGLKAVIVLGGGQPRAYHHDIGALGGAALQLAVLLAPGLRKYRTDRLPAVGILAAIWGPRLRYAATGSLTLAEATELVDAARQVLEQLVIPLVLDGRAGAPR